MIDPITEPGSTTYQVYTLVLTEQRGEDGKWYSMPKCNAMLRNSKKAYPTADAALHGEGVMDPDAVAAFVKRVLSSAMEEAGGVPFLKITITTDLLKPEAVHKVVDRLATTLSHAAEHYEPEVK